MKNNEDELFWIFYQIILSQSSASKSKESRLEVLQVISEWRIYDWISMHKDLKNSLPCNLLWKFELKYLSWVDMLCIFITYNSGIWRGNHCKRRSDKTCLSIDGKQSRYLSFTFLKFCILIQVFIFFFNFNKFWI